LFSVPVQAIAWRTVYEMTYTVPNRPLNPAHSFTHFDLFDWRLHTDYFCSGEHAQFTPILFFCVCFWTLTNRRTKKRTTDERRGNTCITAY